MKNLATMILISLAAATLAACEEKKPDSAAPPASSAKPEQSAKAAAAPADKPAADKPAAEPAAPIPPPPEGAVTVEKIQEDFKADEKKWIGQKVKVAGVYLNTNTSKSGDKETHSITVIDAKGKMRPSISCALPSKPEDLKQYDAVLVEGTVEKMFGASLKDCSYTKR